MEAVFEVGREPVGLLIAEVLGMYANLAKVCMKLSTATGILTLGDPGDRGSHDCCS